jgi:hypothetical protein
MDGRKTPISGEVPKNYLVNTPTGTIGGEGVLQNKFTHVYDASASSVYPEVDVVIASTTYALPHTVADGGWHMYSRSSFLEPIPQEDYSNSNVIDVSGGILHQFRGRSETLVQLLTENSGSPRIIPDASIPWETINHPSVSFGPYHNSYPEWFETLRNVAKDYSILPEYVISNNDEKLKLLISGRIDNQKANSITLDGAIYSSSLFQNEESFKDRYMESDILTNIDTIKQDLSSVTKTIKLTLDCDAFLKFNAKPELYPQLRTVKIAEKFINTTLPYISFWQNTPEVKYTYSSSADYPKALRSLLTPLFAPGILYNTIKSGIAVDFPIFTGSYTFGSYDNVTFLSGTSGSYTSDSFITTPAISSNNASFDSRIPFEALLNPELYINQISDMFLDANYGSITSSYKFSLNYTSSWSGEYTDPTYKLAINNFLAETVDFFSPDGKLTTIFSAEEKNFKLVDPSKKYRALVKIYKSAVNNNLSNYLYATSSNPSTIYPKPQYTNQAQETITMYSRPSAFGPPTRAGGFYSIVARGSEFVYAPFTPPYYDGSSWALLTFTPTGSKPHVPTLEEIQNNLEIKYLRIEEMLDSSASEAAYLHFTYNGLASHYNNRININAMQLSASLNLFNIINTDEVSQNTTDAIKTKASSKVWSIQSKFETPILNFIPSETGYTPIEMEQQEIKTYGMWHQYGVIPDSGKGIYLQITDIPKEYILYGTESSVKVYSDTSPAGNPALTASLADVVGFSKEPIKLGQIATQKRIKEAVLAIPYILDKNERIFFSLNDKAIKYIEKKYFSKTKDIEKIDEQNALGISETTRNQINALEDYLLPPAFDYINNDNIKPICMYVFEFEYNLSQEDLSHIWQGVQPNIADKIERRKLTISHELNVDEFINIDNLSEKLQWLVFKVKKKAKTNYFNKLSESAKEKDKRKENLLASLGRKTQQGASIVKEDNELLYSYNWPYDYFSLVELAKIDATIEFDGNEKVVTTITDQTNTLTVSQQSFNPEIRNVELPFNNNNNNNNGGTVINGPRLFGQNNGSFVDIDSGIGGGSVGGRGQGQVEGGPSNPFSAGTGQGITSDGVNRPSSGRGTIKNPTGGKKI